MLFDSEVRHKTIIVMFIVVVVNFFYFGIIFGINPLFLNSRGYKWFPYQFRNEHKVKKIIKKKLKILIIRIKVYPLNYFKMLTMRMKNY